MNAISSSRTHESLIFSRQTMFFDHVWIFSHCTASFPSKREFSWRRNQIPSIHNAIKHQFLCWTGFSVVNVISRFTFHPNPARRNLSRVCVSYVDGEKWFSMLTNCKWSFMSAELGQTWPSPTLLVIVCSGICYKIMLRRQSTLISSLQYFYLRLNVYDMEERENMECLINYFTLKHND